MRLLSRVALLLMALAVLPAWAEPPGNSSESTAVRTRTVDAEEHKVLSAAVQALFLSRSAPRELKAWKIPKVAVVDPGARAPLDELSAEDRKTLAAMGAAADTQQRFEALLPHAAQLGRPLALTVPPGFEAVVGSAARLSRPAKPFPSVFSPPLRSSLEQYYEDLEKKRPGFGARVTTSRVGIGQDGRQALAWLRVERSAKESMNLWVLLTKKGSGWTLKAWKPAP